MKFMILIFALLVAAHFGAPGSALAGARVYQAQFAFSQRKFPTVYRKRRAPLWQVQTRRRAPAARGRISRSQAARRARGCANGGQLLFARPSGGGYNVRIMQGNRVRDFRVGPNGRCR